VCLRLGKPHITDSVITCIDRSITVLIWVIPVCYSKYSDNKHNQTTSFTLRLCQYTTRFGSAEPSSGTHINVKTQIFNHVT
jgi:hypothetical protein